VQVEALEPEIGAAVIRPVGKPHLARDFPMRCLHGAAVFERIVGAGREKREGDKREDEEARSEKREGERAKGERAKGEKREDAEARSEKREDAERSCCRCG
jgi:hypothetical protein